MGRRRSEGQWAGLCPETGKRKYFTRADAKMASRQIHERMSAFLCDHCGAFHNGHLPAMVRRGLAPRPGRPT